jgi:hypothetical protein
MLIIEPKKYPIVPILPISGDIVVDVLTGEEGIVDDRVLALIWVKWRRSYRGYTTSLLSEAAEDIYQSFMTTRYFNNKVYKQWFTHNYPKIKLK